VITFQILLWIAVTALAALVARLARHVGIFQKTHCARRRAHFASKSYCGGCVVTHDFVNTPERLESLFEAKQSGVTSIQDFLANRERDI